MIQRLNTVADGWMDALWTASLHGGVALLVVWCICRFVPRISPAFKVWLWRIAWFKLLLAFFWNGSIDLPLLSAPTAVEGLPVRAEHSVAVGTVNTAAGMNVVTEPSIEPLGVLFLIWLAGVMTGIAHLGYQWRRSVRLKRDSLPLTDALLEELCSRLAIGRLPALRQSRAISAPVLIGVLRPAVIVPPGLSDDELRMMLAHELAHLKRRDLLWAWLPAICHTLFFFHPLLWLTRREWLLAQEMACDELALRHSATSPAAYGNMLVDLVASPLPRARFGALGICETTQNLKRRILAMKTIGTRNSRKLMFALLIASIAAILPWRIVAQDKPEDTAKRIAKLEQENAELRAQLDKTKQTAPAEKFTSEELRLLESLRLAEEKAAREAGQAQIAAEIRAAEAELRALRSRYTDQHPRVLQAEKKLQQLKERQEAVKPRTSAVSSALAARQLELYLEELALAQKYADSLRKAFEAGRTTLEELSRGQRQLFAIKREIAALDKDQAKLKEIVQEEIELVNRLLKDARKRVEIGTAAPGHDLDLQRELLKLKRELLLLE